MFRPLGRRFAEALILISSTSDYSNPLQTCVPVSQCIWPNLPVAVDILGPGELYPRCRRAARGYNVEETLPALTLSNMGGP